MIKTTYNTIQNKGNHLILQTHLKNSSIFNSTLNYIYKNNYPIKYSKYKLNNQVNSKTSFPTQSNSRKNSIDKISIKNKRNYSNSNIQIKYNINNNNNTPLSQRIHKQKKNNNKNNKNEKRKSKPFNQKAFINGNRSSINKSKVNSKTNSKDQSKNGSKENIISKNKKQDKKYTILESFILNNSCSYKKKSKKNKICHSENSVGKISIIKSNLYKNNVINVKEMRKSENETKNLIENYSKLKITKKKKSPSKNQKEKKKNSKDKKTTSTSIEKKEQKKEKKPKIKIPDSDLETTENNEDNLLKYINSILDINKSKNNLNDSNKFYENFKSISTFFNGILVGLQSFYLILNNNNLYSNFFITNCFFELSENFLNENIKKLFININNKDFNKKNIDIKIDENYFENIYLNNKKKENENNLLTKKKRN